MPTDVRRTSRRFLPATALIVLLASGFARAAEDAPAAEALREVFTRHAAAKDGGAPPLAEQIAALGPAVLPPLFAELPAIASDFRRAADFEAVLEAFRRFPPGEVHAVLLAATAEAEAAEDLPMALRVLGAVGGDGALAVLVQLRSRFDEAALAGSAVKGAIVDALAGILAHGAKALVGVEGAYAGGDETLREGLLDALERTGGPAAVGALARIFAAGPPERQAILRRLLRMPVLGVEPVGEAFEAAIRKQLADRAPEARKLAAMCVARFHFAGCLDPLVAVLADPSEDVSRAAIQALEKLTGVRLTGAAAFAAWLEKEGEWLQRRLGDELEALRMGEPERIVELLGSLSRRKLHRDRVVEAVCLQLRSENAVVRRAACAALARLEAPGSIPTLLLTLSDDDEKVKSLAMTALASVTRLPPSDDPALWHERLNKWAAAAGGAR